MKKTVFLTGATGSMGSEVLRELLDRRDRFDIVILVRDSKRSRRPLRRYLNEPGIRIVWGDLRDYPVVLECVNGADYVLHTAALISPAADRDSVLTAQINVGSIRNILRAIAEQPDPDAVRLVTVGSVAMTGSRLPPIHWGRVGDPIAPAIDDHYAVSKVEAERLVVESGLAHWVSLRQTFICIPRLLSLLNPILFHQPLRTLFEFVTARDSGRVRAFFGSRTAWENIPDWDEKIPEPGPARPIAHGFDDALPDSAIGLVQARSAALFRGGECLAEALEPGDLCTQVPWRCAFGHRFTASAYLVLRAGHWCPDCEAPPWNYDEIAAVNPFFAQVWP